MAASTKMNDNEVGEKDRLSSLPDAILIDILSRIPTNLAAATSVLSHRWRNLWTAVTGFNLSLTKFNSTAIVESILGQLISPKLTEFELYLSSPGYKVVESCFRPFAVHDVVESCSHHVCDRFVEKALIEVPCSFYEEVFWVPVRLISSQFLIVLELGGKLKFDLELLAIGNVIHLPNLKKLRLDFLIDAPLWLGTLIRLYPLLEDLDLVFKLDVVDSQIVDLVDIFGFNLKSLKIYLESTSTTQRTAIAIYTPKLANLEIRDCYSYYYFAYNPSTLVNACIDLRRVDRFVEEVFEDEEREDDDYLHHMSKFVQQMSCVSNLNLKLDSHRNVMTFLCGVDDGYLPIFRNLTRFEITLHGIGLHGWEDLLLSLQYLTKLKHLKVSMEGDPTTTCNTWCPPNYVPDCLVSTLKTIQIWGLDKTGNDLKLLGYILCNASHLEELHLHELYVFIKEHEKAYALWKERQFCKSLFKLPRMSSYCEVVFSGRSITASSNTFKNGYLTCQMYLDN